MSAYISAIGTAVPDLALPQSHIAQFVCDLLKLEEGQARKVKALYRASGIRQRHSVVKDYAVGAEEFRFFDLETTKPPSTKKRMDIYDLEAPKLAAKAVGQCLEGVDKNEVTHLVTVSCTGMSAPGLNIELVKHLGLPLHTARTAINFMGCYGAFIGLKTADAICRADAHAKVVVVCVELCSLHFQHSMDEDQLLSSALFADGAAAVLVEGQKNDRSMLEMVRFHQGLVLEGEREMAWSVGNHGFEMVLSSYVPALLKKGIKQFVDQLFAISDIGFDESTTLAIHPGGKRILTELENVLDIDKSRNWAAYEVLEQYGNMSSATFLFVLQKLLVSDLPQDPILGMAFGPGLTVETGLFRRVG